MNVIIAKDYGQMSQVAAMELLGWISKGSERRVNLAVTAGATPEGMYRIVEGFSSAIPLFPNVHYYNFDEIPVKEGEGVTITALRRLFFGPCRIEERQIEIFHQDNYKNYDEKIRQDGGIDMIMVGLGRDGHFCGNLSGTLNGFGEGCRAVDSRMTKQMEDRIAYLSGGTDRMEDYYVTFGPKTVMQAGKIVMIVSGEDKAGILKQVLEGPVCEEAPASILRLHPDFTVIADAKAAQRLGNQENDL